MTGDAIDMVRCADCDTLRALHLPPTVDARDVAPLGAPQRTGWPSLDAALDGGMLPGLVVPVAPTGAGKTAWCTQLAGQIALTGRPVVYVAVEPTADEIRARLAAPHTERAWRDILIGGAPTTITLAGLPLYVVRDVPGDDDLDEITLAHGGEPVIIVDHLHALARHYARDSERMLDPRRAVGDVTLDLSQLAARRRTVVVAAAQVARSWYSSRSEDDRERAGRDYVAAAKDSGEIEADASYVIYLDVEIGGDRATLGVAKSRYSRSDVVVEMRVDLALGQFTDLYVGGAPAVRTAAVERAQRTAAAKAGKRSARQGEILDALRVAAHGASAPLTRSALAALTGGRREMTAALLASEIDAEDGAIVEVDRRADRSDTYLVWSRARAEAAGLTIRRPS